jgi:predicted nucleic acid-binding protein
MKKINIFLDSSALIAGIISETGAAHVLLQLGETEDVVLIISEVVVNETNRSVARKSPENLEDVRKEVLRTRIQIIPDPPDEEI